MAGYGDSQDTVIECSEYMMRVREKWPGANDEERMEIYSLLRYIRLQLQPVIEARDVPWGTFRQAMDLMACASHNLHLLRQAQYSRRLSHLERELRVATTDEGWDAYLEIDTLRSDEAARRATPRCARCTCSQAHCDQFMTSRSS